MRTARVIFSALIITAVFCLIAYTTMRYTDKKEKELERRNSRSLGAHFEQVQNRFHEALDIQELPDGRLVALLPVDGGASWFVISR